MSTSAPSARPPTPLVLPRRPPLGINASFATISPLRDLSGRPLQGKATADAEGLAVDESDGSLLVSFELRQRIWRYAPQGANQSAIDSAAMSVGLDDVLSICDGSGG